MATPTSKFAGTLVLIAGAMLCVPQVAGASNAHRGPPDRSGQHVATLARQPATANAGRCKTTTTHHTSTTKDHDTTTVDHRDTTTTEHVTTTVDHRDTTTTDHDATTVAHTTTTPAPHPTTTAVTITLIPPLVIVPSVTTPDATTQVRPLTVAAVDQPDAILPAAAPQSAQAVGALLPATGSGHVGVIALVGSCLILMGLLIRRSTAQ